MHVSLQFVTGEDIVDARIPHIPSVITNVAANWFASMPLLEAGRYIPGAIVGPAPITVSIDASGATPEVGVGFAFAINPCTNDYHFGFMGELAHLVLLPAGSAV